MTGFQNLVHYGRDGDKFVVNRGDLMPSSGRGML